MAYFALEGEEVDGRKGKITENQVDKEGDLEEYRVCPATKATESSDDKYHGLGQGKGDNKETQGEDDKCSSRKSYISQRSTVVNGSGGNLLHSVQPIFWEIRQSYLTS
jgi:hypothetical protein